MNAAERPLAREGERLIYAAYEPPREVAPGQTSGEALVFAYYYSPEQPTKRRILFGDQLTMRDWIAELHKAIDQLGGERPAARRRYESRPQLIDAGGELLDRTGIRRELVMALEDVRAQKITADFVEQVRLWNGGQRPATSGGLVLP